MGKVKIFLSVSWLICFAISASAQPRKQVSLMIGSTVDSVPPFKNVVNGPSNLSLQELRGKLVILDFWNTGCSSCIKSIPHLEKLQQKFKDRIQIILINPWETKEKIVSRVSKMKILRPGIGLTSLPNIYGDTVWRYIFPHVAVPHHVWIDPWGKVIATTNSVNATEEHIQKILNGETIELSQKIDLKVKGYDIRKDGLFHVGDNSMEAAFYSGIHRASNGFGTGNSIVIDSARQLYRRTLFNIPFLDLFRISAQSTRILYALKDERKYRRPADPNQVDAWRKQNCYSYEVVLPLQIKDSLPSRMREDLNRFFSMEKGIRGAYEMRTMQTYVLKRRTVKELPKKSQYPKDKYYVKEGTYSEFRAHLATIENIASGVAFEDKTGIADDMPATLALPKDLSDKQHLTTVLEKQGLDLTVEQRPVKVYVVSDI